MATVAVGCVLGLAVFSTTGASARDRGEQAQAERLELMLRTMRITRRWYVYKPTREQLLAGAINGMLEKVDPEAEYYTALDLRRMSKTLGQRSAGIEARHEPAPRRRESPGYRIVSSVDGSAAARAGLKSGDLVTAIAGTPAGGLKYMDFIAKFGRAVRNGDAVTVERNSADGSQPVRLARIDPPGGVIDLAEPRAGVIWVRLAAVDPDAVEQLAAELRAAVKQLGLQFSGAVLDLRATATGMAEGASAVADMFLDRGTVLNLKQRSSRKRSRWTARRGDVLSGKPMTVLVDAGTAGAAEALVAALQDNRRARVVGEVTAGRGARRTLVPVDRRGRKGRIRIATARYLTPLGQPIEGKGITPDVQVAQMPEDLTCRSLDIRQGTGRCARRDLKDDAQLRTAILQLSLTVAAKTPQPPTGGRGTPDAKADADTGSDRAKP
ncbi:MAG: S41 family peptidase [Hyphomicrobiaceae bacterium]